MKILIVDDDPKGLYMLEAMLKGYGYEVMAAENGQIALELARVDPPKLIISDILMPIMDGYILCQEWRKDGKLKNIPFVFYTATYTDEKDEELALKVGADKFIQKPVEPDEFIKVIHGVIRDVEKGKIETKGPVLEEEKDVFKLYSERLVNQLEKKMLDLEQEITERKSAEKRLRLLSSAVEQSCEGIAMSDLEGNLVFTNKAFAAMHGYTQEELVGKHLSIFHTAEQMPSVEAANRESRKTGEFNGEVWHVRRSGTVFPALMHNSILKDETGKPIGMIGTLRDITEQKQADEELRKSEERLKYIIDNMGDIIFRTDLEGNYTFWNKAAEKITGYPLDKLLRMNRRELIAAEYHEFVFERTRKRIAGEPLDERYDIETIHKDGHRVALELHTTPVYEAGKLIGVQAIGRDVTERKQAEEEKKKLEARLQQAQKMEAIGTLAGGIAHDFNNILFPVIGYTEMTMENLPEDSLGRRNLQEVLKAANRAKSLVQQILTFSRQSEHEPKPLEIQPIIKEALKLLRASLPSTIEISQKIEKECGLILGDPVQIHQVMMNLCTNAYHAMCEKGGVLEVSLTAANLDSDAVVQYPDLSPGSYLKLSVRDTGHGMDRKTMDRIYDPYFTTKDPNKGTGLGLSIVHGIVKSHGGYITVYSEPGVETIFHVYLPRIDTGAVSPWTVSIEPVPKGKERILLVDDEVQLVRVMQQMLERLGYHVTARTSSVEALEAFCHQPEEFDLVITDQTMPNMTGAELAQEIMGIRSDIPVILFTGFSEVISEEKAKAMGIREYIMKPVITRDLAKAIRRVLEEPFGLMIDD